MPDTFGLHAVSNCYQLTLVSVGCLLPRAAEVDHIPTEACLKPLPFPGVQVTSKPSSFHVPSNMFALRECSETGWDGGERVPREPGSSL